MQTFFGWMLDTMEKFEEECNRRWLKVVELYAPRRPMAQLANEFRVMPSNPEPPLVYFAMPISSAILFAYAEKYNMIEYLHLYPETVVAPGTLVSATKHLSEHVQYDLYFRWPFQITADCKLLLVLYTNYTIEDRMLIDEDQEDVIQMMQEALGLDTSVRPKWYFDFHDPWQPGDR